MSFLPTNAGDLGTAHSRNVSHPRVSSRMARLLGVAFGVSGLVGITAAALVVSEASTAAASPYTYTYTSPGGHGTVNPNTINYVVSDVP